MLLSQGPPKPIYLLYGLIVLLLLVLFPFQVDVLLPGSLELPLGLDLTPLLQTPKLHDLTRQLLYETILILQEAPQPYVLVLQNLPLVEVPKLDKAELTVKGGLLIQHL